MVGKAIKGLTYTVIIGLLVIAILLMVFLGIDIVKGIIEVWTY